MRGEPMGNRGWYTELLREEGQLVRYVFGWRSCTFGSDAITRVCPIGNVMTICSHGAVSKAG